MRNGSLRTPIKHLRADLHAVARDAEALLKATADVTNDRVQEVRARTQQTLRQALDHLHDGRVRKVARTTDTYVREHSWTAVGVAIGVGLALGLLAGRTGHRSESMRLE